MTITRNSATMPDPSLPDGDSELQSILKISTAVDDLIAAINAAGFGVGDMSKADNLSGLASVSTALTNLGVSAFIQTLLDDVDAATARTTLGAGVGDLVASNNLSDVADPAIALGNIGAEPADTDILKADVAAQLAALFTDAVQTHTGTSLSGFTPTRNKVEWTLTATSSFDELSSATPVSLVFYIKPATFALSFASAYKMYGEDYDSTASEVRVCVDINGSDKRVTIANAKAV